VFTWTDLTPPGRLAIMGILNVTPDSFSDGGRFLDPHAAVTHGRALAAEGADIVDVGGESTRPGAEPVEVDEELRRVIPVVDALVAADVVVSVDTTKVAVAEAALDAGAAVVNDVTAGRAEPEMLALVAERQAGFVAMHMQGEPRTMQDQPRYDDVVAEVGAFLAERVGAALAAGIAPTAIIADPGIGFGKTLEHNLALLAALPQLAALAGAPLLVGASRKQFLAALLARAGFTAPDPLDRDDATLATVVWCARRSVRVVRVHDTLGAARAAQLVSEVAA